MLGTMPRRKITPKAPSDASAEDLPELTPQQLEFVQGLCAGKTASDAYRAAYNCENMQNSTIWAAASRLRTNTKVAAWLSAARIAHLGSNIVTRENHLRELERIKELCIANGNYGAAAQCEHYRGKVGGHYVELYADVSHDPVATLNEVAEKFGVTIARQMANEEGIAWEPPHDEGTKH